MSGAVVSGSAGDHVYFIVWQAYTKPLEILTVSIAENIRYRANYWPSSIMALGRHLVHWRTGGAAAIHPA